MPSALHNFSCCTFFCRPCTHTCITKSLVYISLFKCCFFYLISYYKANMISINYKICWRQEKLLHSLAPCMTLAHSTTSGDELPGDQHPAKRILRDSWKFLCTWRLISFSLFVSKEHTVRINWIELNNLLLILY